MNEFTNSNGAFGSMEELGQMYGSGCTSALKPDVPEFIPKQLYNVLHTATSTNLSECNMINGENMYDNENIVGQVDKINESDLEELKKELFKNSGGKYISPVYLENKLKE